MYFTFDIYNKKLIISLYGCFGFLIELLVDLITLDYFNVMSTYFMQFNLNKFRMNKRSKLFYESHILI